MEEIFRKKAEQDEEDEETVSLLTKYKGTPGSVCIPPRGNTRWRANTRPCDWDTQQTYMCVPDSSLNPDLDQNLDDFKWM